MRKVKTNIGVLEYSFEGYKGTKNLRHYYFWSNKSMLDGVKYPYCQVYGKSFKQAVEMFNNEIGKGFHKDIFNY